MIKNTPDSILRKNISFIIECEQILENNSISDENLLLLLDYYEKIGLYGKIMDLFWSNNKQFKTNSELLKKFLIISYSFNDYNKILEYYYKSDLIKQSEIPKEEKEIIKEKCLTALNEINTFLHKTEECLEDDNKTNKIYAFYSVKSINLCYLRDFDLAIWNTAYSLKYGMTTKLNLLLYGILKALINDFDGSIKILNIYTRSDYDFWLTRLIKSYSHYKLGEIEEMEINWKNITPSDFIYREITEPKVFFKRENIKEDLSGISLRYLKENYDLSG